MSIKRFSFLFLNIVCIFACSINGSPSGEIAQLLRSTPLWAILSSAKDPNAERINIEMHAREICKAPVFEIRNALWEYLTEGAQSNLALSYRLDNARIICAMLFNVPIDHPYREYFESTGSTTWKIKMPFFLADLNRGKNDGRASVQQFFAEFDRLDKAKNGANR